MMEVDKSVAANGKKIFADIEPTLKVTHSGQYVAIEPISGEYYVDKTMHGALAKGKARYPDRQFYTVAIGKPITVPNR